MTPAPRREAHTPGPWRVVSASIRNDWAIQREMPCINGLAGWFTLATVHDFDAAEVGYTDGVLNSDAAEANARLIAAAPALLEALLYAVGNPDFDSEVFDEIARAALRQASGGG